MAGRPGKWEKFKPDVHRLIQEGMGFSELRKEFPQIPKGTLHRWYTAFTQPVSERSGSVPKPPPRLPRDPESPIEKIINALWDVVHDYEGKGVAVQALNALIKAEQLRWDIESRAADLDNMSEAELEKVANGR